MVRRTMALAAVVGTVFALLSPALPQAVAAPGVAQPSIVSDNPANWTPNVLNGQVNALVQVGNRIIAGGIFTQVQAAGGTGPILTRSNMFAFDATTGAIDTGFAPVFDDEVTAIAASPDNQSLYVGGAFSNINGATARSIGKINALTGAKDATYRGGANGRVNDLALSNGRLIIGGQFTTVKTVARNDIASLDPTTGDVTAAIPNSFTGIHNPTARGGAQKSAITKFAVDPAGNKLVAIGNFTPGRRGGSRPGRDARHLDLTLDPGQLVHDPVHVEVLEHLHDLHARPRHLAGRQLRRHLHHRRVSAARPAAVT